MTVRNMGEHLRHRPDIDGLRAVAIVPVVLYHAGVSGVSGGFVGVDIFFVISGYLITSLIATETAEGRFSVVTFYERRIRRIFPALFTVLAACTILAVLLFMPQDLVDFGRSLLTTTLFVSNIHFYDNTNYFDAPLDTKPLLHTWSLAVEEQFYIVFPLILMVAFRWGERRWIGLIAALLIVSLAASIWMTEVDPAGAFYLAPMRAWELMLGALLATGVLPKIKSQPLREAAALGGIALIAAAVFTFSSTTPFPGWAAIIPCLGAALLIYSGEDEGTSFVTKALSLWPVVFIGLISYSLYLWHWPLFVFVRYWNNGEPSVLQAGAIVMTSLILAALSWAYVEQPFRRKQTPIPRRKLFAVAGASVAVAVLFGGIDVSTGGLPARFSPEVVAIANVASSFRNDARLKSCRARSAKNPCVYGAPVNPSYAVWGDSHALAMVPALGAMAERYEKSFKVFAQTGCPPFIDVAWGVPDCVKQAGTILKELETSSEIGTVILISRYALYIKGNADGEHAGPHKPMGLLVDSSGRTLGQESRRALFERQFDLTVNRLLAAGVKVVLVYPVPELNFRAPSAVGRLLATNRDPASLSLPLAAFQKRQDIIFPMLDRIGNSERILRVYPHKRLCNAERCIVYANGQVLYNDDDHLSNAGANFILSEFEPIFRDAPAGVTARLIGP